MKHVVFNKNEQVKESNLQLIMNSKIKD